MVYDVDTIKERLTMAAFDKSFTPKKCERLIENLCVKKPMLFLTIDYKILARSSYNIYNEKVSEVFNNVKRLSYNPNIKDIKLQRCNYPKQQVFYGAVGYDHEFASMLATSVLEVCFEYVKQTDMDIHYMTVSRWQITQPLNVFVLPYASSSIMKNPEFKSASEHFDTYLPALAEEFNVSIEYIKSYLEFISEIFCKREDKANWYKISSAYFNYLMRYAAFQNVRLDGLLYPSANTEGAGINIVLQKHVIDSAIIYADKAIMYKAHRNPNNPKHFNFTDASNEADINADGSFCFTNIW